ncbi:tRNA-uridine aminocarboxypropyltransferase [Psidium guajava]|nr:tRNA-uridine aminocarboxypropyltransferase [Psidium guajava]
MKQTTICSIVNPVPIAVFRKLESNSFTHKVRTRSLSLRLFPQPKSCSLRCASLTIFKFDPFPHQVTSVRPCSMKMAKTTHSNPKRPVCSSCSKPHSLERKHPLNSTRILRLGLKNVAVATASDVNFGAKFSISLLERDSEISANGLVSVDLGVQNRQQSGMEVENPISVELNGAHRPGDNRNCVLTAPNNMEVSEDSQVLQNSRSCGIVSRVTSKPVITFRIGKKGIIKSIDHIWMSRIGHQGADFDAILDCESARDVLSNGFVIRKLHDLVLNPSLKLEEYEEFALEVPRGSVLLFPTENALSIEELKAAEFEVRNLIVLDGTWMKAKRMYSENPWLKLMPHLKLDLEVTSLYGEVRRQPKAGCLSTLESVIYTMKAVGNSPEGLDQLLDVFESMVDDQRRCKDERLGKSTSE